MKERENNTKIMILIIDCGSKKTKNIAKILNNAKFENQTLSIKNLSSVNYNSFSGIIISGSPTLLTEVNINTYIQKFAFIKKNLKIPILGICFGHQIIGLLYKSKIVKGEKIKGKENIETISDDKLFQGLHKNNAFFEDHCEYIDLPQNFIWLAKSNTCPIEAMKHKNRNIYGVQFHPEISGKNGVKLLKNFCNLTNDSN